MKQLEYRLKVSQETLKFLILGPETERFLHVGHGLPEITFDFPGDPPVEIDIGKARVDLKRPVVVRDGAVDIAPHTQCHTKIIVGACVPGIEFDRLCIVFNCLVNMTFRFLGHSAVVIRVGIVYIQGKCLVV